MNQLAEKKNELELVIVTGLSGAGKSEAVRCFEDMGYFCIDNLPPSFINNLVELFSLPDSKIKKVALVCDVRGRQYFKPLIKVLDELEKRGIRKQILFLEATDDVLVKRFKETRRRHPLALEGQIIDGISQERELMQILRGMADLIIDTSQMEIHELRDEIRTSFLGSEKQRAMMITVTSFGYKYGIPLDADMVVDVRFLPNPHYVARLRSHTGEDKAVRRFVLGRKETKVFLDKLLDMLTFLIPFYIAEGKTHLVLAIGCTGGTHRSVSIAEEVAKFLLKKGYDVTLRHRDIEKEHEE